MSLRRRGLRQRLYYRDTACPKAPVIPRVHEQYSGLRPSAPPPSITMEMVKGSVTTDQYKIYKLVWERFHASLLENCLQGNSKKLRSLPTAVFHNATTATRR